MLPFVVNKDKYNLYLVHQGELGWALTSSRAMRSATIHLQELSTPHTRRYTTCEMFVHKNRHVADLSEANSRAGLSQSKQLLKYSPNDVSIILFTEKGIFSAATLRKTHRMTDCVHIHKPRRKTSR